MNRVIVLSILISFILVCCTDQSDDLDNVKAFEKDNKYFKAGLVSLHFVKETSPIEEVDSEFKGFFERHHIPTSAVGCADGVYSGTSPYDAYDYAHKIIIEIEEEEIISVDYNEINKEGIGKQEDKKYNEEMSVTGTSPSIAYSNLEKQLLTKHERY